MLVLSRKQDEKIVIGNSITITIVEVRGDKVRIGIEAPRDVTVHRQEIYDAIAGESQSQESEQPDTLPNGELKPVRHVGKKGDGAPIQVMKKFR